MSLTFLLLLCAQIPPLEFTEHPSDWQLYPRDAQNLAEVDIAGTVTEAGWQQILVVGERDDVVYSVQVQDLTYSAGSADFNFEFTIRAELHAYSFKVVLIQGPQYSLVASASNVVAGDAYLMEGQSNAVAWDAYGEGLANHQQSPWVRSFGSASARTWDSSHDLKWYQADGETALTSGSIGAWGLRMGRLLVDRTGIPVVIINGAVGATAIKWHLRDDDDPANIHTMYGRLLTRARNAGVADSVRAIIWHQGESDSWYAINYAWKFQQLYRDWLKDYPSVEQVYMFQVRSGCAKVSIGLREVQRRLQDYLPLLQVMSTTAAPSHDGCHFHYAGYHEFGNRIVRLIGRDLYGSTDTQSIDAPNIKSVRYANAAQDALLLTFRDPDDELIIDVGAIDDFELEDGVIALTGTVIGNRILLTLSGPTQSETLAYVGHQLDGPWITNDRGVGALTFKVPIQP
ncbi:MAG: hypothetical protein H8E15_07980 [Planctomycetes bacterium]|nr:hypothetical protein [Planctomycetota bacterium]